MKVKVPSAKDPETLYEVDTEAGTCSCPQYQLRLKDRNEQLPPDERTYCKHITHSREWLEKQG